MKSKPSRLLEALIGLALSIFVLWSYYLSNFIYKDPASFNGPPIFSLLEGIEFKLYDARSKLRTSIDAGSNEIVIVSIDDDSLARIGRWPWPRTRIAQMTELLASAGPKVLGIDIIYSEPEDVQGSEEIKALETKYQELLRSRRIVQRGGNFSSEFNSALNRLNYDDVLRNSFAKAGDVVLPMVFTGGGLKGAKPEAMPAAILSSALTAHSVDVGLELGRANMEGMKPVVPLPMFAEAVRGIGHANIFPDFDGTVRREYPVLKYNNAFYPSFPLQLVIRYLGFQPKDVAVTPGEYIQMGKNLIPLDENQSMLISFNGPYQTFRNYSFYDVLNGHVTMDVFKDKIVLLGITAAGISTLYVTPVTHNLPGVELMANSIENMLHLKFLTRPDWADKAEMGSIGVAAAFLMFVLPFLTAFWGAFLTILLLAGVGAAGGYYFIHGLWLKIAYSGTLLAVGYVVITTKRFFATEKGKERVEASAIETNKMLGLSFQGQGQLDLAFEKFRSCPVDGKLKELLYNLGLDFERKRQYNKAAAVYEHIATEDRKYKDIAEKIKVLKQASDGAVFGGVGGKTKEGTVLVTAGASKPTLGRYEVEKEIGRGSMGIVYMGNDPKINRKVAIKTMVLEEGTEAAVVKETKERFFREAESAGTLNHPNIVRIFDAGEENDVSFIAMELLDGQDLSRYTIPGALFAPEVLVEYMVKVAEALDYAHLQGIVHRDIKPANIMLLKDNSIRVTDFGIARITASSKTATGTVVGTPAYMSPEQVSGKKVDGRSDIFSLGVVLYELLIGQKPFKAGDGGIGTLLFQIANDPEPDPLQVNPQLPPCVVQIIHRALKKDPNQRYQKAADMAGALRACLKAIRESDDTVLPEPSLSVDALNARIQSVEVVQPAPQPTLAPVPEPAIELPAQPVPVAVPPIPARINAERTVILDMNLPSFEPPVSPPTPSQPMGIPELSLSTSESNQPQPPVQDEAWTADVTPSAPSAPPSAPQQPAADMRSAEEIAASIMGTTTGKGITPIDPSKDPRNQPPEAPDVAERSTLDLLKSIDGLTSFSDAPAPPAEQPVPEAPVEAAPDADPMPPPPES